MEMVHPLVLPTVLKSVLELFGPKELESLRLVSYDWNQLACTSLQAKKIIQLDSIEKIKNYTSIYSKKLETSSFPHSIYEIQCALSSSEDFQWIQQFITTFARNIKDLTVTVGSSYFDVVHLKWIFERVPHLETLGLRFLYFNPRLYSSLSNDVVEIPGPFLALKVIKVELESYEMSGEAATDLLHNIFQVAPNIVKICHPAFCIPPSRCRIPSKINIFFSELILPEDQEESPQVLKKLAFPDFVMKLSESNVSTLLEKKFPLKHLFLDLWNPEDELERISNFSLKTVLAQASSTLEKVSLDFPWRTEASREFVPQLPMRKLRFLALNGYQGRLLSVLEKLPRLQSLELSQVDLMEILPSADSLIDTHESILSLKLDFCTNLSAGIMSRFSRVFPELQSLEVNHATNNVARMIFQKMHNLTSLRLQGDDLTDEGITGIPKINLENGEVEDLLFCSTAHGNTLRKFPFIGTMPKLQYLKLDAFRLSEASIKHGIVHCTSLHFVSMDTRAGQGDPEATVTRTFKLAEYGAKKGGQDKAATLILREETELDSDEEEAEDFFKKYEKGFLTDLAFV